LVLHIIPAVDQGAIDRVVSLFEERGQLDRLGVVDPDAVATCLDRARARLRAAEILAGSELWEPAFTSAYDAFRTAADALVLHLGFRVPAIQGAHRIATDVANAALQPRTAFSPASAERFRQGRHESEYFDPDRPVDKTVEDTRWAVEIARSAIEAVAVELSAF
jgi:hypothetical protein